MHIQSSKKLETYYVKFYHGRVVERTRHSTSGTVTMPASVEFDKLTLLKFNTKDMFISFTIYIWNWKSMEFSALLRINHERPKCRSLYSQPPFSILARIIDVIHVCLHTCFKIVIARWFYILLLTVTLTLCLLYAYMHFIRLFYGHLSAFCTI